MSTHLRALSLPEGLVAFVGPLRSMDAATWAGVSRLRQDVFVVEQKCPYPDQDLDDVEDSTEHLWVEDGAGVVQATLRIVNEKPQGLGAGASVGLGMPVLGGSPASASGPDAVFDPGAGAAGGGAHAQSKRIGRVATLKRKRGQGIAATLVKTAVARCGKRRVVADVQTPLVGWYEQFGFQVDGEEFLEDNIPHTPMVRPAP